MQTPSATPIPEPGTVQDNGDWSFCVEREIWRLPNGTIFEDGYHKQVFEKVAEIITARGKVRHALQCLKSPFPAGKDLGPICSAFFCRPGDLVYREGGLRVLVRPTTMEESYA